MQRPDIMYSVVLRGQVVEDESTLIFHLHLVEWCATNLTEVRTELPLLKSWHFHATYE